MKTILAVAGGAILGYWLASQISQSAKRNGTVGPGVTTDPAALHGWPVSILSPRARYINPNSRMEAKMTV